MSATWLTHAGTPPPQSYNSAFAHDEYATEINSVGFLPDSSGQHYNGEACSGWVNDFAGNRGPDGGHGPHEQTADSFVSFSAAIDIVEKAVADISLIPEAVEAVLQVSTRTVRRTMRAATQQWVLSGCDDRSRNISAAVPAQSISLDRAIPAYHLDTAHADALIVKMLAMGQSLKLSMDLPATKNLH